LLQLAGAGVRLGHLLQYKSAERSPEGRKRTDSNKAG
jgi:hypothetical protein